MTTEQLLISILTSAIVCLGTFRLRLWLIDRSLFNWLDGKGLPPEVTVPEGFLKDLQAMQE